MAGTERDDLATRLERIKQLTDAFVAAQTDSASARQLAERIKSEIEAARVQLRPNGK